MSADYLGKTRDLSRIKSECLYGEFVVRSQNEAPVFGPAINDEASFTR